MFCFSSSVHLDSRTAAIDSRIDDRPPVAVGPARCWLDRDGVRRRGERIVSEYDVRPPDLRLPARALSGGNQQKLVLGRELADGPRLLLVAQPTRGVDVGAGANLYPALSMLPWCEKILLLEYAPLNIEYLKRQIGPQGFGVEWDAFWDVLREAPGYRAVEPRSRVSEIVRVERANLFDLDGRQRWELGTMFFVADSMSECPEEFRALYRERFGAEVCVGYGMTEAPTAVAWSTPECPRAPGLCGRALRPESLDDAEEQGEQVVTQRASRLYRRQGRGVPCAFGMRPAGRGSSFSTRIRYDSHASARRQLRRGCWLLFRARLPALHSHTSVAPPLVAARNQRRSAGGRREHLA